MTRRRLEPCLQQYSCNGSYVMRADSFALDAPAWREADEIAGRALLAIKPLTTVFST